ncbi:MAG: hypothetical protein ACXWU4_05395, partial [Allosphingosinicella sp.]
KGGDAAAEAAADDPGVPFVRADLVQGIAIGAIEPAAAIEEFVPFVPGEPPWELAGAEKPAALIAFEARVGPTEPGRAEPGGRRKRQRQREKARPGRRRSGAV